MTTLELNKKIRNKDFKQLVPDNNVDSLIYTLNNNLPLRIEFNDGSILVIPRYNFEVYTDFSDIYPRCKVAITALSN